MSAERGGKHPRAEHQDEGERLRQIIHDLRNCLHGIWAGLLVLEEMQGQEDEQRFSDVVKSMRAGQSEAVRLVDALAGAVRKQP